jgi:methionyl-tRNA formyltransferase
VAADGHPTSIPQEECAELKAAPKIFKETCLIDWNQPAKRIYDFVRGLSPYPGAWTVLKDEKGGGTVLKVFRTTKTDKQVNGRVGALMSDRKHLYIACADAWLQVDVLQLAGKKRMDAQAFLNGMKEIEKYSAV